MQSAQGYKIEKIGTMLIKGGLNSRTQKVDIEYYYEENNKPPKVVLSFGISDGEVFIERPSSLRFDDYGSLLSLINMLNKCKNRIGKVIGIIRPDNIDFYIHKECKLIEESLRRD